jgi:diaminopimelate epimerase
MTLPFYKYQGTGNDFVIVDNRTGIFDRKDTQLVARLCDRKFGIGADGLMLLESAKGYDYAMVYYNADGNESTLCGNGGRCLAAFARDLGLVQDTARFMAIDGDHEAILSELNGAHYISLKMIDVAEVEVAEDYLFLNTGSPHYVKLVDAVENYDVHNEGKKIRYNERFIKTGGTNVNFVTPQDGGIFVRTYERGVEGETLSCGTGVTACALAATMKGWVATENYCAINTLGGRLNVKFEKLGTTFKNIWLEGPAAFVFKGEYSTNK